MRSTFFLFCIFCVLRFSNAGYGDEKFGLPVYNERASHALVNAVRTGPQEVGPIFSSLSPKFELGPENTPKPPLLYTHELNQGASQYSAWMSQNCFGQSYCNGTSIAYLIQLTYPCACNEHCGASIGAYNFAPLSYVFDMICAPNSTSCTAYGFGNKIFFLGQEGWDFTQIGIGYIGAPQTYFHYYWTAYFSKQFCYTISYKIYSGSHVLNTNTSISFIASFHDTLPPQEAAVVISGVRHDMMLFTGNLTSGTWILELPLGTTCREYFFYFLDSANQTWFYPEVGALHTYSEGNCQLTYQPAKSPYNLTLPVNSTTSSTTATEETAIDAQSSPISKSSSLAAGYIALIVILIAAVIAIVVGVIFWRVKKAKSASEEAPVHSVPMTRISSQNEANLTDIEVKEKLGGGNFSDVFRGVWQETTQVALKSLKSSADFTEFMNEAVLLSTLNHPNIVRFLGIYTSPNKTKYIVTELMTEGNLSDYLANNKNKLTSSNLLHISLRVAAGMRYLESKNVIHRDLACRNIFVTGTEIIKVGDLGLGRCANNGYYRSEGKTIAIKWSAPEVCHHGKSSSKSDSWSFGVVLWEIFSYGRLPYAAFSNQQVLEQIDSGYRMPAPSNMPEKIQVMMTQCWMEDPEARPTFQNIYERLCTATSQDNSKSVDTEKGLKVPKQYEQKGVFYQ